ncbi:MAG TPA: ABC transporter permease [Methylomirabilota bacterium]|nr:ABC transporter permease [Methylomirabilota bacterium]
MAHHDWLGLKKELPRKRQLLLTVLSFIIPLVIWAVVSYVPWIWHPLIHVTDPGSVDYFSTDMDIPRATFYQEEAKAKAAGQDLPKGYRVNPVYLPAPHKVARAFYTAFTTPPRLQDEPWLHQSLGHSIRTIFLGFIFSSILGVPIGILCGTYRFFAKLQEPFVEFFRYLPAPAFGALCVAILGIEDAPKIAIIFIGTFFQQILIIANSVRKVDPALIEAAQTLGARGLPLAFRVVIPAAITDIYTDLRILLGWAWTYLIVAEVVGTMSGITLFINQQARYRNFDNVYAAIAMIGILGLSTDMTLAWLSGIFFPWKRKNRAAKRTQPLFPLFDKPKPKKIISQPLPTSTPEGQLDVAG